MAPMPPGRHRYASSSLTSIRWAGLEGCAPLLLTVFRLTRTSVRRERGETSGLSRGETGKGPDRLEAAGFLG